MRRSIEVSRTLLKRLQVRMDGVIGRRDLFCCIYFLFSSMIIVYVVIKYIILRSKVKAFVITRTVFGDHKMFLWSHHKYVDF